MNVDTGLMYLSQRINTAETYPKAYIRKLIDETVGDLFIWFHDIEDISRQKNTMLLLNILEFTRQLAYQIVPLRRNFSDISLFL